MPQVNVQVVATDNEARSITLLVGRTRQEYFLGDRYEHLLGNIRSWLDQNWNNYVVAKCVEAASEITRPAQAYVPWDTRSLRLSARGQERKRQKEEIDSVVKNYKTEPVKGEFEFTVIAPHAKSGIVYNGERRWFANKDDATVFCGEIFEGEAKNFELAIVQVVDVLRPKPKTILISSWGSTPFTIEGKTEESTSQG